MWVQVINDWAAYYPRKSGIPGELQNGEIYRVVGQQAWWGYYLLINGEKVGPFHNKRFVIIKGD
jgi:hypothetical protein